ncbi:MAG: LOG family protein, partial [Candidatus Eisenbacteria bacterium]|nr:LOG family protein [Candidatus Eisenbacteria bacterium]
PYITPGLCFQFHYFAMRKMHFLMRAKAMIAFPGGYGTMDELFETLTLIQTHKMPPIPVILLGKEFWSKAIDLQFFVDEGTISPKDLELVDYAETAEELLEKIDTFWKKQGVNLLD